jgi:hypothetical protein
LDSEDDVSRVLKTREDLKADDIIYAKKLLGWLKLAKQGKSYIPGTLTLAKLPMYQNELIKIGSIKYTQNSFSAVINYIRHELDPWVTASEAGIDYAETKQEKQDFIDWLENKIKSRMETLRLVKNKLAEEQKANQVGLFTEEKQVAIYGETIEDAIIRIGGRKVNGTE